MTWLLMWLNVSLATLNATLQLLVLYRFYRYRYRLYDILVVLHTFSKKKKKVVLHRQNILNLVLVHVFLYFVLTYYILFRLCK